MKRFITDCDRCHRKDAKTIELTFHVANNPRKIAEETSAELEDHKQLDVCFTCCRFLLQNHISALAMKAQKDFYEKIGCST